MADYFNPDLTPNDRVAAYFEHITGRPMTRGEKIPLGAVIHGEAVEDADLEMDWLNNPKETDRG
jgi:hypothetical protein